MVSQRTILVIALLGTIVIFMFNSGQLKGGEYTGHRPQRRASYRTMRDNGQSDVLLTFPGN